MGDPLNKAPVAVYTKKNPFKPERVISQALQVSALRLRRRKDDDGPRDARREALQAEVEAAFQAALRGDES